MSHSQGVPYNNRFRYPSGCDDNTVAATGLQSVSQSVDMFGYSPNFGHHPVQDHHADHSRKFQRLPSYEQATNTLRNLERLPSYERPRTAELSSTETVSSPHGQRVLRQNSSNVSRPMHPGKPRRLSRQTSADVRRQLFANSTTASGDGKEMVTSIDSGCDDVFVEMVGETGHHHDLHDTSLFPSKGAAHVTFSTSSTASILPNPYNRINHRIHSIIWCCSCLYFVFFCCLPAIHYMEQCDVEFNRNNQKRARCLGRTASFFFFTGTLITLSAFALIFFLAIFFAVY